MRSSKPRGFSGLFSAAPSIAIAGLLLTVLVKGTVAAACLADFGTPVTVFDEDSSRVAALAEGNTPFYERNLKDILRRNLRAARLTYSIDLASFAQKSQIIFFAADSYRYIEEISEQIARESYSDYHVTYRRVSGSWFALSGEGNGKTFYEKVIFSCNGRLINSFAMIYPTTQSGLFDRVVEGIEKAFRAGTATCTDVGVAPIPSALQPAVRGPYAALADSIAHELARRLGTRHQAERVHLGCEAPRGLSGPPSFAITLLIFILIGYLMGGAFLRH